MTDSKRTPPAALLLAVACSLLIGVAQLLIKAGAERLRAAGPPAGALAKAGSIEPGVLLWFVAAYALLGLGFLLLLVALRAGELSTIYPILAARYVWVVAVTPLLFATESLNVYKIAGAALAAVGVVIVARVR